MKFKLLGDSAVVIYYEGSNGGELPAKVQRDYRILLEARLAGVTDVVPCYSSIGVYFDPAKMSTQQVIEELRTKLSGSSGVHMAEQNIVTIPVYYGGQHGPDLNQVARTLGINPEEIVEEHLSNTYMVWGIGFLPGFPYMGELPKRLVIPRKSTPAPKVAAGSVAIAGSQTGIYPFESPGGWHVIGWTPLKMFDVDSNDPCLLKPGDKVKFRRAGSNGERRQMTIL